MSDSLADLESRRANVQAQIAQLGDWTVRGANAILALRCCQFNGEFEDYWEARRA
jgi:hypothetical protein